MKSLNMQKTINKYISTQGTGLHSGRQINVCLRPAPAGSGISFKRSDLTSAPTIKASPENVSSTVLATTLGHDENIVSTVEHLMAALSALKVDNLLIEVDGPEMPVFDGSATEWLNILKKCALVEQNMPRKQILVTKPFSFSSGDKSISVRPASRFSVEAHIDFDGLIGRHSFYYIDSEEAFKKEISNSRTFCKLKDVEAMQSQGLALGGSLENAVVVGNDGILNPDGLRHKDEFVRHKILDFIGDMAMAGAPIIGQFVIRKPGHEINHRFLLEAFAQNALMKTVYSSNEEKINKVFDNTRLIPSISLPLNEAMAL